MGRKLAWLVLAALCARADSAFESARRKVVLIEQGLAPAGSRIWFSPEEVNAYAVQAAAERAPQGVRLPQVHLGEGWAVISAFVDFMKLRENKGADPAWLASRLLAGERPVAASIRLESAARHATLYVDKLSVSSLVLEGKLLELLVDEFVADYLPEIKVGKPFELKHNVERVEILPAGLYVFIASQPARP